MDKKTQVVCTLVGFAVSATILSVIRHYQEKKEREESLKAAKMASDMLRDTWKEEWRKAEMDRKVEEAEEA